MMLSENSVLAPVCWSRPSTRRKRGRDEDTEASAPPSGSPASDFTDESPDTFIQLNVGGVTYETQQQVLTRFPGRLHDMLQRPATGSLLAHGRLRIDRDGKSFRYVLNYLRGLQLPDNLPTHKLSMLAAEASYYGLQTLVDEAQTLYPLREAARLMPTTHHRLELADALWDVGNSWEAWTTYMAVVGTCEAEPLGPCIATRYQKAAALHPMCVWRALHLSLTDPNSTLGAACRKLLKQALTYERGCGLDPRGLRAYTGNLAVREICAEIIAVHPTHLNAHWTMAASLRYCGQAEQALSWYDRTVALGGAPAAVHVQHGVVLFYT
ncbi:MAG: hypothetical protein EOO40_03840, partial [Deltaproteobacteria bacterium]